MPYAVCMCTQCQTNIPWNDVVFQIQIRIGQIWLKLDQCHKGKMEDICDEKIIYTQHGYPTTRRYIAISGFVVMLSLWHVLLDVNVPPYHALGYGDNPAASFESLKKYMIHRSSLPITYHIVLSCVGAPSSSVCSLTVWHDNYDWGLLMGIQ